MNYKDMYKAKPDTLLVRKVERKGGDLFVDDIWSIGEIIDNGIKDYEVPKFIYFRGGDAVPEETDLFVINTANILIFKL